MENSRLLSADEVQMVGVSYMGITASAVVDMIDLGGGSADVTDFFSPESYM